MTDANLAILHIHQLLTMAGPARPRVGAEMNGLGLIADGAVILGDGRIRWVGPSSAVPDDLRRQCDRIVDLAGRPLVVLPGFVDSHAHPAFAGTREEEYELRIRGATYEEIAARGGGILNSARRVAQASREQITANILHYAPLFLAHGTTTIEAKSGYGLSVDGELKLLRAIRDAGAHTPLEMVPTFLGAHAYPAEYRDDHRGYLNLIIHDMLPRVAAEKLAVFCDVFCDRGFFSVAETAEILEAAARFGLRPKIHADELAPFGAAELAARLNAVGADHLEKISPAGIRAMADQRTVAGLLPGTAFNLALEHYPPARALIDGGVPVALATDFNPGSCFTLNMQLILAIACTQMKMSPAEALTAATINGAHALDQGDRLGSLEPGKAADLAVMDCADYRIIPYFFGVNHCVETIKGGRPMNGFAFLAPTADTTGFRSARPASE
ncbi:MAG: imidazolonepropionase [Acidobacteria bacterium]|nr:imidazolonepropionase [Acidobacteriota bacterium]